MTTKPTLQPIEPAEITTTATTAPDPFAPENFKLSQSFNAMDGVKKILVTVPVGNRAHRILYVCVRGQSTRKFPDDRPQR